MPCSLCCLPSMPTFIKTSMTTLDCCNKTHPEFCSLVSSLNRKMALRPRLSHSAKCSALPWGTRKVQLLSCFSVKVPQARVILTHTPILLLHVIMHIEQSSQKFLKQVWLFRRRKDLASFSPRFSDLVGVLLATSF